MDIQIRESTSDDLEKIIELQTIALKTLSVSYNAAQIASLIRSQTSWRYSQDELSVVAEQNRRIIGVASLLVLQERISGVYVHPDFMRQNIGSQLLKHIEDIAIEKECKTIYVTSSLDTVDFYEANDYKRIRPSGFYSERRVWIPCINLEKQLIDAPRFKKILQYIVSRLRPVLLFIAVTAVVAFVLITVLYIFSVVFNVL